jgi:hypothetical protein
MNENRQDILPVFLPGNGRHREKLPVPDDFVVILRKLLTNTIPRNMMYIKRGGIVWMHS